jgi:hypothetical protein
MCKMHVLQNNDSSRAIQEEPAKGVPSMMHQTVENTTYCLNCTNVWPTMWEMVEKGPSVVVCPKCQWRLGVPIEFISSGWWTTEEFAA